MISKRSEMHGVDDETGMSLVEVVVAIVILALLSTITLNIYLTGMGASKTHQNREIAITVANQSLETVTGWTIAKDPVTGTSTLYKGRSSAAVNQQWAEANGASALAATYPAWDPTANASSIASLPLATVSTFTGTDYTSHLFIGTCYQKIKGGDCAKLPSYATAPPTAPSGYAELIRVVVLVTWTVGDCGGGACTYEATTLIDPSADLEWVTTS